MELVIFVLVAALPFVACFYTPLFTWTGRSQYVDVHAFTFGNRTLVFLHYDDGDDISLIKEADTPYVYSGPNSDISHLQKNGYYPAFFVFDAENSSGFGAKEVIGYFNGARTPNIQEILRGSNGQIITLCSNCFNASIHAKVGTWRDATRNRWVTIGNQSNGDTYFLVSTDLKVWVKMNWLLNLGLDFLKSVYDMFPIAEKNNPGNIVWVLLHPSKKDANGRSQMAYSTFVPDDNDLKYKEMGIFDHSYGWGDVAVATGKYNKLEPQFFATFRSSYRRYGLDTNAGMVVRSFSYSNGVLSQQFPPLRPFAGFEKFARITYVPRMDIFGCIPPARHFSVEASFTTLGGDYGYHIYVNGDDVTQYGMSLTVTADRIVAKRAMWLPQGVQPRSDEYESVESPFRGKIKKLFLLVAVDDCLVQYFADYGVYVGLMHVFPNKDWVQLWFVSESSVVISDMLINLVKTVA